MQLPGRVVDIPLGDGVEDAARRFAAALASAGVDGAAVAEAGAADVVQWFMVVFACICGLSVVLFARPGLRAGRCYFLIMNSDSQTAGSK